MQDGKEEESIKWKNDDMDFLGILLERLPFEWSSYQFMRNAFTAILVISPMFALLGTGVISNRLSFFSDVLGHSALTGLAIGSIMGVADPQWIMIAFAALLAFSITAFRHITKSSSDTVLGVFFAIVVAAGVVVLSKGGGFSKYTSYLIGDILAINQGQVIVSFFLLGAVILFWLFTGNAMVLANLNYSLAKSKGIRVFWLEVSFSVLLAVLVTASIRIVGILMINSLLILPAAASRLLSKSVKAYTLNAMMISVFSGIAGLVASYYLDTSSGATIVLVLALIYCLSALIKWIRH
jgi:zinc transport system permease protein